MAESSGFFNSSNGDRKYRTEFFAEYFSSFIGNGVFSNPSTGLQIISNNNMSVTVKAGKAWINGYYYSNNSDLILPVAIADGVLSRIDRIVLRYDTVNREIRAVVKKGNFASSPVSPSIQRDADAYELALADIAINKGAVSITQSNITDLRLNTGLCGVVHGTVDQVDTTTLWNQYKAKFEETSEQFEVDFQSWFTTIQNSLNGDVAGNLLNKINTVEGNLGDVTALKTTNKTNTVAAINEVKEEVSSHKADNLYQTAGGTGTAITLTINGTLSNGYPINFIASDNNGGAATTINGKPLYKPSTTAAPTLRTGKAYTVWYNSSSNCFFIKASATGTVTSDKVLAGETYSTEVDTDLVGTMPNLIGVRMAAGVAKWGDGALAVYPEKGYQKGGAGDGEIKVTPAQLQQADSNFISSNIASGKSIFGLVGAAVLAAPTPGDKVFFTWSGSSGIYYGYYNLRKSFKVSLGGAIRVKFGLRSSLNTNVVYGRIYVNGVARGIERSTSSTNTMNYYEDITVNANDTIEFWVKSGNGNNDAFLDGVDFYSAGALEYITTVQ